MQIFLYLNIKEYHLKFVLTSNKSKLLFLSTLIVFSCINSNKTTFASESNDIFIKSQSENVLKDTQKPIEESVYFSLIIKNIKTGRSYIINSEQSKRRESPASTFKIPLSLMGFDSNILIDENTPKIDYNPEYKTSFEFWKKSHTPSTWMKNSVVWYSQELTILLGLKRFQEYVELFNYGNKDIKGNLKRGSFLINDATYISFAGLLNSWLSSSLKISPVEQVNFLQKLVENKIPVSQKAVNMTKKIVYKGKLNNNFDLYGKTGTAQYSIDDKKQIRLLWFVGWLEKEGNIYVFASNRYVNVLNNEPFYPFADKMSEYLQNNFSTFKID
jgi:beta-lactamase class D